MSSYFENIKHLLSFALLLLTVCSSCNNGNAPLNNLSESEFIDFISNTNLRESVFRIDSIAKTSDLSNHKTGLLYYEKGRILGNLEKDVEAIGSLNKALTLFEEDNNKLYVAKTNMLLSDSNAFLSNNDTALQQINLALKIFREQTNKKGEAKALNSLAHIEFQNNNLQKSIAYVKQAAAIQLETKEFETLAASYNNIGIILEQLGDLKNAKEYYRKAIELNTEIKRLNSSPIRNLGYVLFLEDKFKKCDSLYLNALKIEEKAERLPIQKEVYGFLLESSIKNKSFKNSTLYIAKRDSISDLLVKEENEEKIKLIEDQYNLIAKEKELIQVNKSNTKNKIIFAILAGSLLFFGLFLIQKNRNTKLELEQEKLMLEQKVLRTQMNPHFIFNALTSIQKTIFDNDPIKSTSYLSKFAKLIRQNFEFVNKKEIFLSEDLDALKNYIETQQLRFDNTFNYSINTDKSIDASYIKIPPMLLQPFVENAIEHGLKSLKTKGNLTINISKKNNLICFKIIDNGIGIKEENKNTNKEHAIDIFKKRLSLRKLGEEKLFSISQDHTNQGTTITFYLNLA